MLKKLVALVMIPFSGLVRLAKAADAWMGQPCAPGVDHSAEWLKLRDAWWAESAVWAICYQEDGEWVPVDEGWRTEPLELNGQMAWDSPGMQCPVKPEAVWPYEELRYMIRTEGGGYRAPTEADAQRLRASYNGQISRAHMGR